MFLLKCVRVFALFSPNSKSCNKNFLLHLSFVAWLFEIRIKSNVKTGYWGLALFCSRVFWYIFRMKKRNDFQFTGISMTILQFVWFIQSIHLDFLNIRGSTQSKENCSSRWNVPFRWSIALASARISSPPSFHFTFLRLSLCPSPLPYIFLIATGRRNFTRGVHECLILELNAHRYK